jgi:hypothetical protein
MYGSETGDPLGVGLGVLGTSKGGGGIARSLGTGKFGPMGHGDGTGEGQGIGASLPQDPGPFHRPGRPFAHTPRAPSLHTQVAYEVVDRVWAANARRLRACVSASAPKEVTVRFVVSTEGAARDVSVGMVEGISASQALCLTRTWSALTFLPAGNQDSEVTYRLRL